MPLFDNTHTPLSVTPNPLAAVFRVEGSPVNPAEVVALDTAGNKPHIQGFSAAAFSVVSRPSSHDDAGVLAVVTGLAGHTAPCMVRGVCTINMVSATVVGRGAALEQSSATPTALRVAQRDGARVRAILLSDHPGGGSWPVQALFDGVIGFGDFAIPTGGPYSSKLINAMFGGPETPDQELYGSAQPANSTMGATALL